MEGLLPANDIQQVTAEFEAVYALEPLAELEYREPTGNDPDEANFHVDQLEAIRGLPSPASPHLNLLILHPHILGAVAQLLGNDDLRIYTSYIWHKETGQTDFNQAFHRDYPTHQLLVPPEDPTLGAVALFIYLTDVSQGNGALSYVPLSSTTQLGIHRAQPTPEVQRELQQHARYAEGKAGTVLFYSTETFHRGTSLTEPNAVRRVAGAAFHRADCPWMGRYKGEFHPMLPQWQALFSMANPDQLAVYGVPRPGHVYWSEHTIRGVEGRFPEWDSDQWRTAAGLPPRKSGPPAPALEWPSLEEVSGVDLDAVLRSIIGEGKAES